MVRRPLGVLEILSRLSYAAACYYGLFALSRARIPATSTNFVHLAMGVYGVISVLLVRMIAGNARSDASTTKVWWVYFWATHNSVVLSAYLYLLIANSASAGIHLQSGASGLTMLEAVYLSLTTFTTIGYGDIVVASPEARLLVLTQGVVAFLLTLVLALVLARSIFLFLQEDRDSARIRERVSRFRGYAALHRWDRVLFFTAILPWNALYLQMQKPVATRLSFWQWILVGLGLLMPFAYTVKIIRATRDPVSAPSRVRYLFTGAIAMVFTAYPCLYWLAGHAYGAFGEDSLSITDSFALSIGNMVAHPYAGIAPANDLGRGLILVQQISMFTLLAVALAFVSARWEPSKEVQQAWRYVTRTRP